MKLEELYKTKNGPLPKKEQELLRHAYTFAEEAHKSQERKSGDPYFNHCFETAKTLREWGLDSQVIAAGLLHDTAEDTEKTLDEIKKKFGGEIAKLVDGVTKLGHFKYREQEETKKPEKEREENFRKMILAISTDVRIIFIKLADRLHNMKTLKHLPEEKQKRIALETYGIYAPLAYRLGMVSVAGELEDLCLPFLFSKDYKWLQENVPERYDQREKYLKKVKKIVEKELKKHDVIPIEINFRAKRLSSLHKKLKRYDMNLDQIHDLVAMRIIVDTIEDCYKVLGILHSAWKPLPKRLKDYIALPKPNGYQSLHTTVFCLNDKITEFQIRTKKMHEEAQHGLAAHWAYAEEKGTKSYKKRKAVFANKKETAWIKDLQKWQKGNAESGEAFMAHLQTDFFEDRIYAITPKGDVVDLPTGATPVDLAYNIHSQVGNECTGAKVNGKIVPLTHELHSGDVIEILRQKNKKPSESWLKFVKTSMARDHIRQALRKKEGILEKWAKQNKK